MDLQELRRYLDQFISSLVPEEREILEARLQGLVSVFPFGEYEYILMFLRDRDVISFEDYERLRDNYVSANRYLARQWHIRLMTPDLPFNVGRGLLTEPLWG